MSNLWADALSGVGLALTLAGAWLAAKAVILKPEDAINIGLARFSGETDEENLKLPMVQNLLAASQGARRGLLLVAGGTGLQFVPIAVRLICAAVA